MTKTIKNILIIGSAAFIIGIGGIAIAGMGYGSHMGDGYGRYHMDGYRTGHMGNGYGGMGWDGSHMVAANGYDCNSQTFDGGNHGHYRGMNRDMYRYQSFGSAGNGAATQRDGNTK